MTRTPATNTPLPPGRPVLRHQDRRGIRRGVSLLPSLFTLANLFCGWSSIVYAMHGNLPVAAPFIGMAMVMDMLDGRIARMTGTSSEFGVQLDSLADVISFGMAPAVLAYVWGLAPFGRLGWALGFLFVCGAALRLARFNIQHGHTDKRYFVGLASPAAAAIPAATVFYTTSPSSVDVSGVMGSLNVRPFFAIVMVLIPALLMVSTIRFRSFKSIDMRARRRYTVLAALAAFIAIVVAYPHEVLLLMAWGYLLSAFVEMGISRFRHRDQAA